MRELATRRTTILDCGCPVVVFPAAAQVLPEAVTVNVPNSKNERVTLPGRSLEKKSSLSAHCSRAPKRAFYRVLQSLLAKRANLNTHAPRRRVGVIPVLGRGRQEHQLLPHRVAEIFLPAFPHLQEVSQQFSTARMNALHVRSTSCRTYICSYCTF